MSGFLSLFVAVLAVLTYAGGLLYCRIWRATAKAGRTPTGFGGFLALALVATCLVTEAPGSVLASFAVLAVATAIYWIDDVLELSVLTRILVSLVAGAALSTCLLFGAGLSWPLAAALIFGAGLANLVLTNLVNFYDGADLNLATFVALTAAMMLAFDPPDPTLTGLAFGCLGFILAFGVINSRPRTLYLGDAGAFAFAGLLTALLVIFFIQGPVAPEVVVPLALPALDTFYVLVVRIIEKHDLLTRNYLHLYQQLEQHQKRFYYLLPQIANAVLVLTCAWGLQRAGLSRLLSVVVAATVITPPFYFSCRKLFLPRTTTAGRNS